MKDGDSGDEYRGGKRGNNEGATVPRKLHVSEKSYWRGDEDDIRYDVRYEVSTTVSVQG